MSLPAVNYHALETERANEMQEDLRERLSLAKESGGRRNTLRNSVLTHIVNNSYEAAVQELEDYVESRQDYPNFQDRVRRYVSHCSELVHAIDTKRNFPGLVSLSLSKQQELYERVLDHFEELKSYLKQIEQVERDVKIADVRTTVWFVKTCMNCAIFVMVVGLALDLVNGLGASFNYVLNVMTADLTNLIFSLF